MVAESKAGKRRKYSMRALDQKTGYVISDRRYGISVPPCCILKREYLFIFYDADFSFWFKK